MDEDGWNEPPGFHLIPLPYADDLRAVPIDRAERGTCPSTFAQTRTRTNFWVGVQLQMKSKRQLKNGFRNSVSRMGLIHLIRIQIQVRMHLDIPVENSCDWVMI